MRQREAGNMALSRSSRFIINQLGLFFKTRESDIYGPYSNLGEANRALEIYVALMDLHEQSDLTVAA